MDIVGGSAQSAVDSLLGRLSSVFVEEAQLLRNVHGDMQFIRREMESMNGFLLDADDDGRGANGNQVRVWRRHVHELAYDSQSSVDRYVQTFGACNPCAGAGLLASFRRAPELVRTLPTRHRIASEIRGLKARAIEVGERRQRYGVMTLPPAGDTRRPLAPVANEEVDDARRRRALDSGAVLFDIDTRAKELVAWLLGKPPAAVPRGRLRRNQLVTSGQLIKKMLTGGGGGPNDREDLKMELIKLFRGLYANDNPENVVEAAGYLSEAMLEVGKQEVKVIGSWLLDKLFGRADMEEPQDSVAPKMDETVIQLLMGISEAVKHPLDNLLADAEHLKDPGSAFSLSAWKKVISDILDIFKVLKEPMDMFRSHTAGQPPQAKDDSRARQAAAANEELLEMIKTAKEPMEVARAEARYVAAQLRWLLQMFKDELLEEHVYQRPGHRPKVVAIVTPPPVDGEDGEEPEELVEEMHATELARKVYDHPSASSHFHTKVWVNATHNPKLEQRLRSILHQVLLPGPVSSGDSLEPTEAEKSEWMNWSTEKLMSEISGCLKGKRFLIVLADPEDESSWLDITSALPDHGDSAVIVTPKIKYMAQFDGWYTASWFFLLMGASSRYHVHFCSNLVGLRKVAAQLVGNDQPQGGISAILKKCLWDSFTTKMFLHALYANPHRSEAELDMLLHGLRYASSVSNARRMIRFCFDDLPRQYQTCLVCLSIFPQGGELKRASLVRRWAAESFVSARDGMTAVDEAGRCFDALVARGLLEPADIGVAGKVKSCTLHPHVLFFITRMAKKDGIIDNTDIPLDLAHRLSTRGGILQLLLENQASANSNTCCCWGMLHRHRRTPQTLEDLSHQVVTLLNSLPASSDQLGLVKFLDLEGCKGLKKRPLKKICDKIFQLKYLSLRNTDATELPKEINKLRYLETLDIRQTKIRLFPENTIALPKLMHLLAGCPDHESSEATGSDKPFSTVRLPSKIASMANMQVLSHVEVSGSDKDELENVGRKLHLRKLGVVIRGEHPLRVLRRVVGMLHETLCSLSVHLEQGQNEGGHDFVLDAIEIPKSLESLNIKGKINELPTWIRQLHRLSKITLCRTELREEDIQRLGEIANLRCIRLWHLSYTEKKLTFNKSGFRKLEFLVIEDSCICNIEFDENAAPRLRKIVWSLTGAEVTLSGIEKLQNLKEVHISGSYDKTHLSKIRKDASKNPNLPKVTPIDETNVAAATNAGTTASYVATGAAAATNASTSASNVASGVVAPTDAATAASPIATITSVAAASTNASAPK